jgi:hypothetical protein
MGALFKRQTGGNGGGGIVLIFVFFNNLSLITIYHFIIFTLHHFIINKIDDSFVYFTNADDLFTSWLKALQLRNRSDFSCNTIVLLTNVWTDAYVKEK